MPPPLIRTVDFGQSFPQPGFSDWEVYWFDLGFFNRWNWIGEYVQSSRLTVRGLWLTITAGSLDFQAVAYEPIRWGETYEGGLFDGEQVCTTTLHLQGAAGCTVRLGFCSWPNFTDKAYEEVGPWGDNDEHVMRYSGAPGPQPCTGFFAFKSDGGFTDGVENGLAIQFSAWHIEGPEYVPPVGPPPPPPKGPPGVIHPGAQSLGHFPLRAR